MKENSVATIFFRDRYLTIIYHGLRYHNSFVNKKNYKEEKTKSLCKSNHQRSGLEKITNNNRSSN